jgi:hypothetical protein
MELRYNTPILPIVATSATNAQLETSINGIAAEIKSIATKITASQFDEQTGRSFALKVQNSQGGKALLPLTPNKVEVTQALQAAIAMVLAKRIFPRGDQPDHPLLPSSQKRSPQHANFKQWQNARPDYEGPKRTTKQRKRQWIAKYVRENITTDVALAQFRDQLAQTAVDEIYNIIRELYPNLDLSINKSIQQLVGSALNLTIDMMGKDLPIIARWIKPGETFTEEFMEMTDISMLEGVVVLCVFPRWVDSDNFTITNAKVYCSPNHNQIV